MAESCRAAGRPRPLPLSDELCLQEGLRESVARFMAYVHTAVNQASRQYLQSDRRYNYTTPKSFLEQISLYSRLLTTKNAELAAKVRVRRDAQRSVTTT